MNEKMYAGQEGVENMRSAFVDYVRQNNISLAELEEAYHAFLTEEERVGDESHLLQEMRRMERSGFPINGFLPVLEHMRELENVGKEYAHFVDTLSERVVSKKEKQVLRSFMQGKTGELTCFEVNARGVQVNEVTLRCNTKDREGLLQMLWQLKFLVSELGSGNRMEIQFVED